VWCAHSLPLLETILTPTDIACLLLLRPLLIKVIANRRTIASLQPRWFATRDVETNADEMPLGQVMSDCNCMLSPPLPLLVSGSTTPRNTIRSTEHFSVH
jgi:hypothetical protein